jgi:hypothetical protein
VEITHRSGDMIRIRVCKIEPGQPGHLNLAFEDDARHFQIERPERHRSLLKPPATEMTDRCWVAPAPGPDAA